MDYETVQRLGRAAKSGEPLLMDSGLVSSRRGERGRCGRDDERDRFQIPRPGEMIVSSSSTQFPAAAAQSQPFVGWLSNWDGLPMRWPRRLSMNINVSSASTS